MADDVKLKKESEGKIYKPKSRFKCCKGTDTKVRFCINCKKFWHINYIEKNSEIKCISDNTIAKYNRLKSAYSALFDKFKKLEDDIQKK